MAAVMAEAFSHVTNGELVAVGSRNAGRAEAFAAQHGIARSYGSYDDFFADPQIDAVYIATPHPQHADLALAAIAAGKPILVEKAFTASALDTRRVVEAARTAGVFAMEAMWTRFNPAVAAIRDLVAAGEIGELRAVHGDLTARREFDPADRLFNPDLGGGAILDLGVYVVSFAQHFLGAPDLVRAVGGLYDSGVEGEFSAILGYADGRSAALSGAFTAQGPGRMMLLGTDGWIDLHPRFHRSPAFTLWRGKTPERREFPSGYQHEVVHVGDCLAAGLTESPIMPLDDTIAVQEILDDMLSQVRGSTRDRALPEG